MLFHLLRYADLKERGIVKSRAQLKQMIDNYGFPSGKLISPNVRTWTTEEVAAYYDACPTERKSISINLPSKQNPRRRGRARKIT
jgi:hypothetical protein